VEAQPDLTTLPDHQEPALLQLTALTSLKMLVLQGAGYFAATFTAKNKANSCGVEDCSGCNHSTIVASLCAGTYQNLSNMQAQNRAYTYIRSATPHVLS
jgi:hypothetical protein